MPALGHTIAPTRRQQSLIGLIGFFGLASCPAGREARYVMLTSGSVKDLLMAADVSNFLSVF